MGISIIPVWAFWLSIIVNIIVGIGIGICVYWHNKRNQTGNKFWKYKRDPENIRELMTKMVGDFPDYQYWGFLEKFTIDNPNLKKALLNEGYFVEIGKNNEGVSHVMLGKSGTKWVLALKTVEYTESIKNLTRWLMIWTAILAISAILSLFKTNVR